MRSVLAFCLGVSAIAGVAFLGCSGDDVECNFDTDCSGSCEVCNASTNTCEKNASCEDMLRGDCQTDADCDPIYERCDDGQCRPYLPEGGNNGDDGGTTDGDQGPEEDKIPDECLNPDLNCSVPQIETPVTQGRDRDSDGWGMCCDCDDLEARVNPSKVESIYNCRDDDCNPDTKDDDLDNDGFGSILRSCAVDPGSDCDDSRGDVHPGATEECDGVDNDCDGKTDSVDGETVCIAPKCQVVSGEHSISPTDCPVTGPDQVDLVQGECDASLTIYGGQGSEIVCNGQVDDLSNLYLDCSGGVTGQCSGKVSVTQAWRIFCPDNCYFTLQRTSSLPECSFYDHPSCTGTQRCGVICSGSVPSDEARTVCVNTIAGGKLPGFFCDPAAGINCANEFCLNNVCTSACWNNDDCADFPGTACKSITYNECSNSSSFTVCNLETPGETVCNRSADCNPSSARLCSYRKQADSVATICASPIADKSDTGMVCTQDSDCKSDFCVCEGQICSGSQGRCTEVCAGAADCPSGSECAAVSINDLGGTPHQVNACTWTGGSCGRDADCPQVTPVCTFGVNVTFDSLVTQCTGKNENFDVSNNGVNCASQWDCYSLSCLEDYPRYCTSVCSSDSDCNSFDDPAHASCAIDADCSLGHLCDNNKCQRTFQCLPMIYALSVDPYTGQMTMDAIDLCRPQKRQCILDSDCRAGEACKPDYSKDATAAIYMCAEAGPGTGAFGTDCSALGNDDCLSGMCLTETAGEGASYCSKACLSHDDCTHATETFRCMQVSVPTPYGITQLPACGKWL